MRMWPVEMIAERGKVAFRISEVLYCIEINL